MTTKPSMARPVPLPTQGTTPFERQVLDELRGMRDTQREHGDLILAFGERVVGLEAKVDEHEGRLMRNSSGVARTSESDSRQDAAIAQVITRVDSIEGKVDAIHSAVVGVITNKKVVVVGRALFALAAAYMAGKGLHVLP